MAVAFDTIAGAAGIGVALSRAVSDYREKGTITSGWAVVMLVFLAIALIPVV